MSDVLSPSSPSSLMGAAHAVSEIVLREETLRVQRGYLKYPVSLPSLISRVLDDEYSRCRVGVREAVITSRYVESWIVFFSFFNLRLAIFSFILQTTLRRDNAMRSLRHVVVEKRVVCGSAMHSKYFCQLTRRYFLRSSSLFAAISVFCDYFYYTTVARIAKI